jgi:hypothetical protein
MSRGIAMKDLARPIFSALVFLFLWSATGCRSVQKEAGFFKVTASGMNLLFFTIPPTSYELVRARIQRDIGDTAQVTNISRTGSVPPWWNVFNKILGVEIIQVYGTY